MELIKNKLIPSANMHLKDIRTNDIHESYIFLGKYDSKDNYVEVTEAEYQAYLTDQIIGENSYENVKEQD